MAIPDGWRFAGEMQGHYRGRYVWIEPVCAEPHSREVCANPHSETDDGKA
jgi:hypothetical protein